MPKIEFLGKGDVEWHHPVVPFYELKAETKKSVGDSNIDGNLIIHGDNLLALKALLPRYEGRVKCIYIDPPYNTGSENWIYNDKVNSPLIKDWHKKVVDRDDQCRHDKWMCMMWPRLQLLREMLTDDGVIFVSIDDNEQHHLRDIMDEIFGEKSFIGNIIWKKTSGDNKPSFAFIHDNIFLYGKSVDVMPRQSMTAKQLKKYSNPDNDSRGDWAEGDYRSRWTKGERKNLYYPIKNPNTGEEIYPDTYSKSKRVWGFNLDAHIENEKRGIVWWGKDGKAKEPKKKRFLCEHKGVNTRSVWLDAGSNDDASKMLQDIFPKRAKEFSHPKPVSLVKRIIKLVTNSNDVILDSFAGSGTTAHAVLELNKEDGGNRKFILVEGEKYADKITAERVRRVIKGVPNSEDEVLKKGLGGSFTYATLGDEIDPEKILSGEAMPSWETLARHVFWLATGNTFSKKPKFNKKGFVGTSKNNHVYLIYKPDIDFMQSDKAVLTGHMADDLSTRHKKSQRVFVYAAAAYVSRKDMGRLGIIFCQLPWEITKKISGVS